MSDERDNVVALRPGQLSVEQMDQLRSDGLLLPDAPAFDDLELDYPASGEVIVGELTGHETALFTSYFTAYAELDSLRREIGGSMFHAMGDNVRQGKEPDMPTLLDETIDPATAAHVHRLWRQTEVLKHLLFWQLGERLDCHEYVMGVRRGRKVVRGQRKY